MSELTDPATAGEHNGEPYDATKEVDFVRWSDVKLTENNHELGAMIRVQWTATLDGPLFRLKGENSEPEAQVRLLRCGKTGDMARDALKQAVEAQGWEIR